MTTNLPVAEWLTIAAMLEHNAVRFGGRAALSNDEGEEISHQQLWDRAADMVAALNGLGVGRGDRVALVLPQGPDLALAFLGVAAGATAAPLNPAYLEKEFLFYLEDLQARALLLPPGSNSPARAAAGSLGVPVIEFILDGNGPGQFQLSGISRPLISPGGLAVAGDVALVLHTSGTTSRPKMVPLTHANLLASARHIGATLQLQPADRCLNVMPLFHIHGLVAGVLASLNAGGSVVCTRAFAAGTFFALLKQRQPTWYSAVPTMHQAVLAHAQGLPARPLGSSLRFIRSSSAALPPPVMAGLEAAFGVPVIEAYGMTEAAHQMASNPLPPRPRKPGSVGPAAGPEMAILDEAGQLLAGGRTGEVAIRGPNVTSGYANHPEAKAAAFGNGWFRTGDQGYLDHEGYLFITGRLKELINRGGEKIAPREIDEVLLAHPGVRQAVAFAVPHPSLGEDVAAAVVLKDSAECSEAGLREFAFDRLPAFKVPNRIVFVKEAPKGPTGKLQRIGLASRLAAELAVAYEPPVSDLERLVAATMGGVLGCEAAGRHDNFFSLGGDSLRATQLLTRLGQALEFQIPAPVIFRCPTPALLAGKLERMRATEIDGLTVELEKPSAGESVNGSPAKAPPAIRKCQPLRVIEPGRVAVYPASAGQQRMWFLHHYAQGAPVYCVPSAFRLTGPLNPKWLEAAFHAVIQRHDILRTTFAMDNGELCQCVAPASNFRLREINLEEIPDGERTAAAERSLDEETSRPFDLSAVPPFRAVLVRLQSTEHVLLLVLHHIISDGWSRSNFYRELAGAYAALATGQPAAGRELPVQFADYSAWQKDWLQGAATEAQAAYWKRKLANEPEPLDLPADRTRPATESFRGGRCTERLEPKLTDALKSRAQEEGATFFMVLLAAFTTLLHRYTGHDDLTVGVPIANRQRPEWEELIGYFSNTLVLRTTFPPDGTFRELLRRVKETAVEAYAHQDLPFERLVELLQVRRDASRTPLFQASFAMQDFPAAELNLPGIQTAPWFVTTHTSKFDFSLTLERSAEGWTAAAEYSTDLFDAGRVERMLRHWRVILENVAANPGQRVSEIPLLTAVEQRQILVDWNRTEREYPRDLCVHQLFEAQVKRTPDAVAAGFEGKQMTYRELDARASQLARRLRSLGVGPEVLVGLCVERSLEMIVGMLGILKAGGAYVPLDPKYPKERIDFILQDAAAPVVVTQRQLGFGPGAAHCVYVEEMVSPGDEAQGEVQPESAPTTPANLAYVIYTSGSTGKPKGVAIEHRSAVAFLQWVRDAFADSELSGVLAATSICFDLSVFEIFGPLSWGGRVLIVDSALDLGSPRAPKNVSLINTVPSALAELLRGRSLPPSVRTVNLAGEALRQPLAEMIFQKTSAGRVNDLYGPTETTVYSTWAQRKAGGLETVGHPIANTQIYILDARGQPLPVGIQGELYIGGEGVARGYWRRPELTAERFVPDRFSGRAGRRLFKTGDRARWLADGNVVLLGRADGQVKLRGFRIELGEIETALRARPEVREAAVILREDTPGDQRLVAYLVAQAGGKPAAAVLRTRLAETLPEYLLPNAFVWLERLPLTPNGKTDRSALPAPETSVSAKPNDTGQPATPLELQLIRIWQDLFHRPAIQRNDNFFELGGHSLLALRLTTEIEKLAGRPVPIAVLFQAPTITALARKLEDENWLPPSSSLVTLQPMGTELPVFCIHGIYGEVYRYLDLARELAPDRPVYGLQAVGLDGRQPRHTTVEEMAAHYAREIRSVLPDGPYHLVGLSLGGWIAHAVAQELSRQGGRMGLLTLLDTRATANVPWPVYARVMAPYLAHRMRYHVAQCLHGPEAGRLRYVKQKLAWLRLYLTRTRGNLPVRPLTEKEPPAAVHLVGLDYFEAVAARYRPAKYAGNVTVFAGDDAQHFHHSVFWKHFVTGRVEVHFVAGGHGSLIHEAHVAKFAQVFKQALRQAEVGAGYCTARE